MKKYLKKKGWIRYKEYEEEDFKVFFFDHPKHGEYQLHYNDEMYLLSDDSDELELDEVKLTKKIIKRLTKEYINKGIKTY